MVQSYHTHLAKTYIFCEITVLVNDLEHTDNDVDPQNAQQTLEIAEAYLRKVEGMRNN